MLIYSRRTLFGFVDPANATDEDNFYGETVEIENEEAVLAKAAELRAFVEESNRIQTEGFESQSQAVEMATLLAGVEFNVTD